MKKVILALLGTSLVVVCIYADNTTLGCFSNVETLMEVHPDIKQVIRNAPADGKLGPVEVNMIGTLVYFDKPKIAFWTRKCSTDLSSACKSDEKNCKQEYMLGKKPKS